MESMIENIEHWKGQGLMTQNIVNEGATVPADLLDQLLVWARLHCESKQKEHLDSVSVAMDNGDIGMASVHRQQAATWQGNIAVLEDLLDETR